MTTKKKTQNQIAPELQTYLDKVAAEYQPDPDVLKRRIENAEARYNKYQNFADNPARLMDKFQTLLLEGWKYDMTNPQPVMSNPAMIAVTLQKPESMIVQEIRELRTKVSDAYNDELFTAMESEIDELVQQAAEDSQRKVKEQAAAEQAAIRDRLRSLLSGVKA